MKTLKNKKPVITGTKINTYLPVFQGFYGSIWDNDNEFEGEAEYFNLPENFPFYDYANYSEWHEALSKQITSDVETVLIDKGFVKSIKYQSLYSPREYNFKNDSINCEIIPNIKNIKAYIYANRAKFEQYLRDHLTSRDGFISFQSNDFKEWEQDTRKFTSFKDKQGFNLGFILQFICEDKDIFDEELSQFWLYEQTYECTITQYYNSAFYAFIDAMEGIKDSGFINLNELTEAINNGDKDTIKELTSKIEQVQNFVKQNYLKKNVTELTKQEFTNAEWDLPIDGFEALNIDKIIDSTISEIEKPNLKLNFN